MSDYSWTLRQTNEAQNVQKETNQMLTNIVQSEIKKIPKKLASFVINKNLPCIGLAIAQKILSFPKLVAQHSEETAKGKEQLVINATAKIRLRFAEYGVPFQMQIIRVSDLKSIDFTTAC